ncbi:YfcE family phosphodiesterase [Longibacter salinarum]|uniref:Phosphoesterase n=1 Tax=Longibacter salinarum TaxID=1850348 RepID=A0A2A8CYA9_9BACT|nr:metallophosphoesterase family protein [Longibacter salinarum]PEN13719.1 YfcE family phosphodiesterase [Longibacter salinarum]
MTTLGILSDTHGYFHPDLVDELDGVDHILHAGDIGDLSIIDGLKALAPVTAVYGNVDGWDIRHRTAEHQRMTFDGVNVWMTHIAGRPGAWQRGMGAKLKADPPDVFICGHSHILRIERVKPFDNMLYLNPGAAGRQGFHQKKTCVRLVIDDGAPVQADVIHLDE